MPTIKQLMDTSVVSFKTEYLLKTTGKLIFRYIFQTGTARKRLRAVLFLAFNKLLSEKNLISYLRIHSTLIMFYKQLFLGLVNFLEKLSNGLVYYPKNKQHLLLL